MATIRRKGPSKWEAQARRQGWPTKSRTLQPAAKRPLQAQTSLEKTGARLIDACNVSRYSQRVIKTFLHKGLKAFFETGSKAGIQPRHAARLRRQLAHLDAATEAAFMNVAGWRLHALTGALAGQYAVTVNGNWRLTFAFEDGDAVLVDYQDYH